MNPPDLTTLHNCLIVFGYPASPEPNAWVAPMQMPTSNSPGPVVNSFTLAMRNSHLDSSPLSAALVWALAMHCASRFTPMPRTGCRVRTPQEELAGPASSVKGPAVWLEFEQLHQLISLGTAERAIEKHPGIVHARDKITPSINPPRVSERGPVRVA